MIPVSSEFLASCLCLLLTAAYTAVDIFSCHGISGIVGLLMTGIFCQSSVAANDGFAVIGMLVLVNRSGNIG